MAKQSATPLLVFTPVGNRVFCLTRYRADDKGTVVAYRKHDVTDNFRDLMWSREVRRALRKETSARVAGPGVCGHGIACTRLRCRSVRQLERKP